MDHKIKAQIEDKYINQIVNLYVNNQDNQANSMLNLYLELGYIQDIDKLESRIKSGIQHMIKLNREFQERINYNGL